MKTTWRTLWQQQDIVVYRDEVEFDRIAAARIECVYLIYRSSGESPGDIGVSIVELDEGYVLFEAQTGFAGRVNFERQAFWRSRECVYWVSAAHAALPWRLRLGAWSAPSPARACRRLDRAEFEGCVAGWQLEGPETWDDRKQRRIERQRPFGFSGHGALNAAPLLPAARADRADRRN